MIKERSLIRQIRRMAAASINSAAKMGIGDDCAVLRLKPGYELLVTTDLCLENVHFRRAWHPPTAVGHRCLTRGLSDIAAMGGEPLACFLSLGLPVISHKPGLQAFCAACWIWQSTKSNSQAATFPRPADHGRHIVTGQVPSGTAILRSGAKPGDRLYVTGNLGGSAATLKQLFAGKKLKPERSNPHFYPTPRLEVGKWIKKSRLATAMIDISDGLSVDLRHICDESGVAAILTPTRFRSGKTPILSWRSTAAKTMNSFLQPPNAPKFPHVSPESPLPKSVR